MTNSAPEQPRHFAAIDLGSNSFHLVIVRALKGDLQTLFKHKERVRLASGLNKQNVLSREAIQRGVDVLQLFAEQLQPLEDCHVMAVATHTLREAENRDEFLEAAQEVFPYPIDIISGQEEARLIYNGVAHDEQLDGNTLVIDIGGGSTEVVIGNGTQVQIARSHQMGCVSFTHRYFKKSTDAEHYHRAKLAARQRFERFEEMFRRVGWQNVRITSGTAQAIVSAAAGLDKDFTSLELKHIHQVRNLLFKNPQHSIFKDLTEERVSVLAAGLAIMETIYDALHIQNSVFSSSALREGILYEALETDEALTIRGNTCDSLMRRYHVDMEHAERVAHSAAQLWQATCAEWKLPTTSLKFLTFAAKLHEVGLNISSSGMHKHSAYIVENSNMPGFSFEQQLFVASLIRLHRKKINPNVLPEIRMVSQGALKRLIVLLRIAIIWHLNRHPSPPPLPQVAVQKNTLTLTVSGNFSEDYPLLLADLQREVAWCDDTPSWPMLVIETLDV